MLQDGTDKSTTHQLALITALRKLLSANDNPPTNDAILETPIMVICDQILKIGQEGEEFYFLKLEALWLLTNFGGTDDL